MNIKHWRGYGKVVATKQQDVKDKNGNRHLQIQVVGNHEWGIETHDTYTVLNWLVKKFDRSLDVIKARITELNTTTYTNDEGVDICNYYITYKNDYWS